MGYGFTELSERYGGIQARLKEIGASGCLFLALCTIVEEVTGRPADIVGMVQHGLRHGWLSRDYTVNDSVKMLDIYTGKAWKRDIVPKLPEVVADNEFTIVKWHNKKTGYTHFRRRFVDTLEDSQTVRFGEIESYYVYSYKTEER